MSDTHFDRGQERLMLFVVLMMLLLLLTSCMTPRQADAVGVLRDLYERRVLTIEQFNALVAALSPSTWVSDAIAIGAGLLGGVGGGVGGYVATNVKRNAMRRARGEPVAAKAG